MAHLRISSVMRLDASIRPRSASSASVCGGRLDLYALRGHPLALLPEDDDWASPHAPDILAHAPEQIHPPDGLLDATARAHKVAPAVVEHVAVPLHGVGHRGRGK